MYALPGQTLAALDADLRQALAFAPPHLSIYQLTIEANTLFAKHRPALPGEDEAFDMLDSITERCAAAGLQRYEVSAYARPGHRCRHNANYWEFGDYLGIGAGAHGKVTLADGHVLRLQKTRLPKDYLAATRTIHAPGENPFVAAPQRVAAPDLPFEFMLNALRLVDGVDAALFTAHTGLDVAVIAHVLHGLRARGLLVEDASRIACTPQGLRFLNDAVNAFAA
jgi:oxygen-independent coproporphyrinogen-3 oxidase